MVQEKIKETINNLDKLFQGEEYVKTIIEAAGLIINALKSGRVFKKCICSLNT